MPLSLQYLKTLGMSEKKAHQRSADSTN